MWLPCPPKPPGNILSRPQTLDPALRERFIVERAAGRNLRRFGYSTSGGELVPDEREQAVVARMRGLKVKGCSLRGLAQRLNDEGLRPKRGER